MAEAAATRPAAVPRRPFPQHVTYTQGTITPRVPQVQLDQTVTSFYRAWKRRYLVQGCGPGRYYKFVRAGGVGGGGGEEANSISSTEGHGYGMIITALLAGHDPRAQETFDGLTATSKPSRAATTRPSDFVMHHLKVFRRVSGEPRWQRVIDRTYALIDFMQRTYAPRTGLLPDFIDATRTRPRPAAPGFLEEPTDGQYAYHASRLPWRITTDYLMTGDARAKRAVHWWAP